MLFRDKKNNEVKYFVSIGAGYNQVPLIREAKKQGFHVISIDQNTTAAGFLKSDIKIQESVEDYEEIYLKLREFLMDGNIKGILSRSYGNAIRTTCHLAQKLKIPYIPCDRVEDFLNKKRMKKVFGENEIPSPRFVVHTVEQLKGKSSIPNFEYPFIVKPLTGHAKSGVKLILNETKLSSYCNNYEDEDEILIEEYVTGDEIIAVGIVFEGKFSLVEVTDKILTPEPYFLDIMHLAPTKYSSRWNEIAEIGQKIAKAFEVITSPLVFEMRVDSMGSFNVIEATPEFGGEFLTDIAIPSRTGYNFLGESIKALTYTNYKPLKPKKNLPAIAVHYITATSGNLVGFDSFGPESVEGVIFSKIFKQIGAETSLPRTNHDRIGVVIAIGKTTDEAISRTNEAIKKLNINIVERKSE